ncbi:MAG: HEAT repeat domain-containing protein [Nitrospirae bacterium]|nr:HEAT repeat domain-containing protein [Nitrospirota bacterium]
MTPMQVRMGLCVVLSVGFVWLCTVSKPAFATGVPASSAEVQSFYDKHEYQKALEEIGKLDKERAAVPDVRRLKVRSLLKLGNPKDALEEYDKLEAMLKQDDQPLLREVALGFIVVMMKDMREQMRGAAYTALKEVNSDEMVPYFEDGLSDGSALVRFLAVEGLSRSEAGRRSTKLRTSLEDPAGRVKALVVKVLGRTGDPGAIPLIESATKDELTTVRIAAYGALIKLGRKEMWEQVRKAAEAPNPEDRAEAIHLIADLKDERGVSLMTELLTYKQPSVRGAAARGLGHLGRKEARGQIERLLQDPVPAVRKSAVLSLADLGGQESVQAITPVLNDGQVMVRAGAITALLQLDQPYDVVASTARALAQQNDTGARAFAAEALGKATKANSTGAISQLMSLLADPLPGPKIVAIRSLGHIGNRELLPALKDALHDTNEAVRATAGGALLHLLQPKK